MSHHEDPMTTFVMPQREDQLAAWNLSDQLLYDMISNWVVESSPITSLLYRETFRNNRSNYYLDNYDPLNILVNSKESDRDNDDCRLLKHDHVINQIPLLINRPDAVPQLRIWFPLLKKVLLERLRLCRSAFAPSENDAAAIKRFEVLDLSGKVCYHFLGSNKTLK